MSKICFPHYKKGEFESLQEAYTYLRKENYWSKYNLFDIVRFNVRYRDHFRKYGFLALMAMILEDECLLAKDKEAIDYLCKCARNWSVANYDIQCYNIKDKITVLGHTFDGLKDIIAHREVVGKQYYRGFECFVPNDITPYKDVHIGEIYDNYPSFDSYDSADNRTYQNYIFRKREISAMDMKSAYNIQHISNFCKVHENIPEEMLPILYYNGDGKYMLLATAKLC